MTVAPNSSSLRVIAFDCAGARVTTTVFPERGSWRRFGSLLSRLFSMIYELGSRHIVSRAKAKQIIKLVNTPSKGSVGRVTVREEIAELRVRIGNCLVQTGPLGS